MIVLGQPPRSRLDDSECLLTKLFSISLAAAQPLAGRSVDARRLLPLESHMHVSGFCFVLVGTETCTGTSGLFRC